MREEEERSWTAKLMCNYSEALSLSFCSKLFGDLLPPLLLWARFSCTTLIRISCFCKERFSEASSSLLTHQESFQREEMTFLHDAGRSVATAGLIHHTQLDCSGCCLGATNNAKREQYRVRLLMTVATVRLHYITDTDKYRNEHWACAVNLVVNATHLRRNIGARIKTKSWSNWSCKLYPPYFCKI